MRRLFWFASLLLFLSPSLSAAQSTQQPTAGSGVAAKPAAAPHVNVAPVAPEAANECMQKYANDPVWKDSEFVKALCSQDVGIKPSNPTASVPIDQDKTIMEKMLRFDVAPRVES